MFEKVKDKLNKVLEENNNRKEEKARIAKEAAEERERKKREELQIFRDSLLTFTEKELIIETIITLREQKELLENIEHRIKKLEDKVETMEINISTFGYSIDDLKRNQ